MVTSNIKKRDEHSLNCLSTMIGHYFLRYHCSRIKRANIATTLKSNFGLRRKPSLGAVSSWLVRSTPESSVRFRSQTGDNCVVFLDKTLDSHSYSPPTICINGEFNNGG